MVAAQMRVATNCHPMKPSTGPNATGPTACFDLDGVLIDSEIVKIAAWIEAVDSVLAPAPELRATLDSYNRSQRGIPRRIKFAHAVDAADAPLDRVELLLEQYARLLRERSGAVTATPGAAAFLDAWPGLLAVASSAPIGEVEVSLDRLSLGPFAHIFGYPISKTDALRGLSENSSRVVFFGDAAADRAAAQSAGVPFVGIGPAVGHARTDLDHGNTLEDLLPRIRRLACESPEPCTSDGFT
jgi:beta-phosphoglucomutase-like phosphatase (HAD superfamily)